MTALNEKFTTYQALWHRFSNSKRGRLILKISRALFLFLIIGFLAYKLYQIGWKSVWMNLPTQPLFYLILVVIYLLLPLTEVIIYRIYWKFDAWRSIPAFIKKKIYNLEILSYSGEAYFFTWARKNIDIKDIDIAKTIRDNNIISSVASNFTTLLIIAIFLKMAKPDLSYFLGNINYHYFILAVVLIIIVAPLAIRFREYIFSTPLKTAFLIFGIQLCRLLFGQVLQILQWSTALPSIPLATWIAYATVSIALTRIPFPSNKNLVFMGIGVEMATHFGIHQAAMFGILGIVVAINKILNLSLFIIFSFFEREKIPASSRLSVANTEPSASKEIIPD